MKNPPTRNLSDFTEQTFIQSAEGNRNHADFRAFHGILKAEQNHFSDSKKEFLAAIRCNPDFILPRMGLHYLNLLTRGRIQAGNIQSLALKLTQTSKKAPLEDQLFVLMLLLHNENLKDATPVLRSLNKAFPSHRRVLFLGGLHDFLSGKTASARKKMNAAIQKSTYLGKQLGLAGTNDSSFNPKFLKMILKEMLRRAFIIPVRSQMAAYCAARSDFNTSLSYLTEIQKLDPESYEAFKTAGDLAHSAGKKTIAIQNYIKAQASDPFRADAAIKLSFLYGNKSDLKKAFSILQECLKNNPRYPDLHHYLAENHTASKRYALAEKHLLKALSLNPSYTSAWFSLAALHEKQKKFDLSLKSYLRAISISMPPRHLVPVLVDIHKKTALSKKQSLPQVIQKWIRQTPSEPLEKLLSMIGHPGLPARIHRNSNSVDKDGTL